MRTPYAVLLDALGLYLERTNACDVLIDEIEGGFLLGFLMGAEQRVVTLDAGEMARLQAEALRHKGDRAAGWTGMLGRRSAPGALRARLRTLGEHLDRRAARAIVAQERAHGFSVEFTTAPQGTGNLMVLTRLHETIDDQQLLPPRK